MQTSTAQWATMFVKDFFTYCGTVYVVVGSVLLHVMNSAGRTAVCALFDELFENEIVAFFFVMFRTMKCTKLCCFHRMWLLLGGGAGE